MSRARRSMPSGAESRFAAPRLGADDGFSMVEAMVAVTVLLIAIMLSMQPLMASLIRIADSRRLTVAENLAQAEIEAIRALDYGDVGSPGYTPDGVLPRERTVEIEGRLYLIETRVSYEGSLTGLNVVEQGGDGVQGSWDPGIDYKFVQVTVSSEGTGAPPVVMETIVAPGNIGAHEGIANARVTLAAYEPFEPGGLPFPSLKIQSPPAFPVKSGSTAQVQVFAAIPEGDYTVSLDFADGWVIHPEDTAAGNQQITAVAGMLADTSLRVYRPARLLVVPTDAATGALIPDARVSLVHTPSGVQTDYAPGVHTIEGLMPDAYDITVSATDYHSYAATSVNIPAGYPDPDHLLEVALEPLPPPTTTSTSSTSTTVPTSTTSSTSTTSTVPQGRVQVTITVRDNTGRVVNGATVKTGGGSATTDAYGRAYFDLNENTTYNVTADTKWGHGPVSGSLNTGSATEMTLYLTRPSGKGTMVLFGGSRAEFLYSSGSSWVIVPPNHENEASFVADEGWRQVAKRCLADGSIIGTRWAYVDAGSNRGTTIYGSCP